MAKKKNSLQKWLLPFSLVIGGLIGYFGVQYLASNFKMDTAYSFTALQKIGLIFSFLLSFLVVLFMHELGHIIGGLAGGDEFGFLVVGPFRFEKEDGRIRLQYNRDATLWGGVAMTLPQHRDYSPGWRALLVAGGPLASLLLGLALWLLLGTFGDIPPGLSAGGALAWISGQFTGLISWFIFVATIIPSRAGGFMSDGMQLLYLLRNDEQARAYAGIMQLFSLSRRGTRPADYPPHLLNDLDVLGDDSGLGVGANLYQYYHYLDQEDLTRAGEYLNRVEEHIDQYPAAFQDTIWAEIYLFEALYLNQQERLEAHWQAMEAPIKKKQDELSLLTKAVRAHFAGEDEQQIRLFQKGKEQLTQRAHKDKGLALLRQDMYQRWADQLLTAPR